MVIGREYFHDGFVGVLTDITNDGNVFWLHFPGSVCSEPYTKAELEAN